MEPYSSVFEYIGVMVVGAAIVFAILEPVRRRDQARMDRWQLEARIREQESDK